MNGGGDAQNGPAKQLTAESLPVFNEGVYLILSRWSGIQLAIEEEWAGRRSRQLADQLASDIVSWFTQPKAEPLYIDDLEDFLDEGMIALNCEIEDGSVEEVIEVAEKLMILHEECLEADYSSVEKLRRAGPAAGTHQHIRQVSLFAVNDDDDDSSEDESDNEGDVMPGIKSNMAVDSPAPQPRASCQMEDDGWTVVSSNRNKGRRN
ncbi:unnamed protein product [Linum tenue]|uniref:Pre-rRNA-processing protein TSR2 homolog n=1 Tax=Linum tenue TaxID=586396 RepID=A0AAV0L139_9ROSI|nr:unnamed protein product [Linum tenue]